MRLKLIFSVILIVVVLIFLVPTIISCGNQNPLKVQTDVDALRRVVIEYHKVTGELPSQLIDLVNAEIILRLPSDPWGYDYQYAPSKDGFVIWSRGSILEADFSSLSLNVKNDEGNYINASSK